MKNSVILYVLIILCSPLAAQDVVQVKYTELPFKVNYSGLSNMLYTYSSDLKIITNNEDERRQQTREYIKDIRKYFKNKPFNNFKYRRIISSFAFYHDYNTGIEYRFEGDNTIRSPIAGVVSEIGYDKTLKRYVVVHNSSYIKVVYGNLDNIFVEQNQHISPNQSIGTCKEIDGDNHLKMIIKYFDTFIDPEEIFYGNSDNPVLSFMDMAINKFYHNINYEELNITKYYENNYNEQVEYYLNVLNETDILFPLQNSDKVISIPFLSEKDNHLGINYKSERGSTVYAPVTGRVIERGYKPLSFGSYIVIMNEKGICFDLGHMKLGNGNILVSKGSKVVQGQKIAKSGNGGYSLEPSLHFGISIDGFYINPEIINYRTNYRDVVNE